MMIDLDDVLGSLHRDARNGYLLHDEIEAFVENLREAEKDAARYRWLRDIGRHEYDVDDFFGGSSDSVDGKIDQAMKDKGDE